jgi:hypothetical protein
VWEGRSREAPPYPDLGSYRVISNVVRALPVYPYERTSSDRPPCSVGADSNDLQRAIAPAKASRGGNAALRAILLRMYSAIRMPSGAENQMQIRSEAVL